MIQRPSRRSFLALGGVLAAGAASGCAGTGKECLIAKKLS